MSIGDFRDSAHMEPGLTTIRLPAKQIGELAVGAIIKMSETGLPPSLKQYKVDMTLMKRNSPVGIYNISNCISIACI